MGILIKAVTRRRPLMKNTVIRGRSVTRSHHLSVTLVMCVLTVALLHLLLLFLHLLFLVPSLRLFAVSAESKLISQSDEQVELFRSGKVRRR